MDTTNPVEGEILEGVANTTDTKAQTTTSDNVKFASYGSIGLATIGLLGMCCGGVCCLPFPIAGGLMGFWAKDKTDDPNLKNYATWGMYISIAVILLLIAITFLSLFVNLAFLPFIA